MDKVEIRKERKPFLPEGYLPHGPWGNLSIGERREVIDKLWKGMSRKEQRVFRNMADEMGVRAFSVKSLLSLLISLHLDERTRFLLEEGYFGVDTVKIEREE